MDPKDKTTGGMVSGMSTTDDTQTQPTSGVPSTGAEPTEPVLKGVDSTPEPSITPPPPPVSEPTGLGAAAMPTPKVEPMAEPTMTEPVATTGSLTSEEPAAPASPSEEEGDETGGTGGVGGGLGK